MSTPTTARATAIRAHGDQRYGDGPYVRHLDEVAALCRPHGEVAEIIAYLHDALEDTALTAEEVEAAFGAQVRACVEAVTDAPGATRKVRKAATYARLEAIDATSPRALALLVKSADRLANVRACVRDDNAGLLGMYRDEHAVFVVAVGRTGLNDAFMHELAQLLAPRPT